MRLVFIVLVAWAGFSLASVLALYPYGRFAERAQGEPSFSLPVSANGTLLDALVAPLVTERPGQSGLMLLAGNLHAFAVRELAARGAGRSLDLQYYIWDGDLTGRLLANELLKAADRGVRVRPLLDDINAQGYDRTHLTLTRTSPFACPTRAGTATVRFVAALKCCCERSALPGACTTRRGSPTAGWLSLAAAILVTRISMPTRPPTPATSTCSCLGPRSGRLSLLYPRRSRHRRTRANVRTGNQSICSDQFSYRDRRGRRTRRICSLSEPLLEGGVRLFELKPYDDLSEVSLFGSSAASLHTKAFTVDDHYRFIGSFNFDPRSVSLNCEMAVMFQRGDLVREVREVFAHETSPQKSYRVWIDDGEIRWQDHVAGAVRVLCEEPEASVWRRLTATTIGSCRYNRSFERSGRVGRPASPGARLRG